jgi:signal transduction histidine kinase/PAS domain-containing protein/ActR/RegA family two-component response regulator
LGENSLGGFEVLFSKEKARYNGAIPDEGNLIPMAPDSLTNSDLLIASRKRFLEECDDYLFVVDSSLVYRSASDSVAHLAGFLKGEDLVGRNDIELFGATLGAKYQADDRKVMETGTPIKGLLEEIPAPHQGKRYTKTWKWPLYDEAGHIIGIQGFSRDVTAEIEIKRAASDYSDLIQRLPGGVGIIHFDHDGYHLDFGNEAFFTAQSNSRESWASFKGQDVLEAVYPPDRVIIQEEFAKVQSHLGEVGSCNYRVKDREGKLHWVNAKFSFAYQKEGIAYYYVAYTNLDSQKQAETKLRESRAVLAEAIANSDIQFFTYYPQSHRMEIFELNQRLANLPKLWAHYPEDLLAFFNPEESEKEKYRTMIASIDQGAKEAECVCRFTLNGNSFWERVHLSTIYDEEGRPVRAQGYSLNVSAGHEEQERYDQALLTLKEAADITLTSKGHHNLTKDKVIEYSGNHDYLPDNFLDLKYEEGLALFVKTARLPEDQAKLWAMLSRESLLQAYARGQKDFTYTFRKKPNVTTPGWILIKVTVLKSPVTGDIECFIYTYDATERALDQSILGSLKLFGYDDMGFLFLESGACLAYVFDPVTGHDRKKAAGDYETIVASLIAATLKDEERAKALATLRRPYIEAELTKHGIFSFPFTMILPSGEERLKELKFVWEDQATKVVFFWSADVTERSAEERKRLAEMSAAKKEAERANAAKSDFLSRMSHDMRTPLNGIIGMTYLAQEEPNSPKTTDCLNKIDSSSKFLLGILNDILDMSKAESGKMEFHPEPYPIKEFTSYLEAVIRPLAESREQTLEVEFPPEEGALIPVIDKLAVNRIFFNLLSNAVKYTPIGGHVSFHVDFLDQGKGQMVLQGIVKDDGIGMSPGFLTHIFEPFRQENRNENMEMHGTGLGLSIAKKIIDLLGGKISVESTPQKGSTFLVNLPCAVASSSQKPEIAKTCVNYQALAGKHILLCEDNPLNVTIAKTLLEERKIKVTVAGDGAEGLAKFSHSKPGEFAAILMDIRMPKMNGYDAAKAIRNFDRPDAKSIPIIAMTADAFAEDVSKAEAAGMNAHIAKPIDPGLLFTVLSRVLH